MKNGHSVSLSNAALFTQRKFALFFRLIQPVLGGDNVLIFIVVSLLFLQFLSNMS